MLSNNEQRWRGTSTGLLFPLLCCVLLFTLSGSLAFSRSSNAGLNIQSAEMDAADGVYNLNAKVDYLLSDPVNEALRNGVKLVFQMDIEVRRERRWWLDDEVADLSQRYTLSYHALSRRYLVDNANAGAQETFTDLDSALRFLGTIENLPVLDVALLDAQSVYRGRMKIYLVLGELPLPLRARGYVSSLWRLATDWYTWQLP